MKYSPIMLALVATGLMHHDLSAAQVTGVLKDERNQVIANTVIKVRDQNIETKSDADGRFVLNLPEGEYTLDVKAGTKQHFHQSIRISEETDSITVQMPYHMNEILVVKANPLEHTKLDMATPSIVMSGDELSMNRAATLGDILEKEPGVSMASFGPAVARPVIRGLAGGRVVISNNQMIVQDASTNSDDHDVAIEPLLADQIEVLKGPATLLYGSGAIGGVVNVTDSRFNPYGADGVSGGVEVRMGDSATSEESVVATLNGGTETFTFHLDAFSSETDNIEIPVAGESAIYYAAEEEHHEEEHGEEEHEEELENLGYLENSQSKTEGFTAGTTFIRDWGYVGLAVNHSTSLYGIPGGHSHGEEEHADEEHAEEEHHEEEHHEEEHGHSDDVAIDMEQTRVDIQGSYNNPAKGFSELFFGFTNTNYSHVELEGDEVGTKFSNDALEFKSYLRHEPVDDWNGIFGVQWMNREFKALGEEAFVPPSETTKLAFFALEEKRFDDFKIELGLRAENQSISVRGFEPIDETVVSFSAGTVIDLTEEQKLAINLSSAERVPSVEELYSFGEHLATRTFEIGDPNLKPEQSLNLDISYRFQFASFTGEINGYWNNYSDFIYGELLVNDGTVADLMGNLVEVDDDFPVVRYTQGDASIRGVELSVDWHLMSGSNYDLTLGIFADMIEAELDEGDDELPRIPPWKSGITLHYDWNLVSADLTYTSYADQDKITANELPTNGFDMLDFALGYRAMGPEHDFLVFLKAKNLLDEEARDHASYLKDFAPRAGRSLVLGVRYQF